MGFVFVFLPSVLLLLYPCRCFQIFLNCLGCNGQTLRIFMDAFQGSYRIEPHDLRQFSASYLLLRFLVQFSLVFFLSKFFYIFNAVVILVSSLLFAVCRPYRKDLHNNFDIVSMLLLSLFFVSLSADFIVFYLNIHPVNYGNFIFGTSAIGVLVYVSMVFLYHCGLPSLICRVCKRAPRKEEQALLVT